MLDLVYFSQTLCSHYSFIHLVLSLFLAFGSTLFPYFSCNCGSWWHSNYNCAMTSCFFLGRGCWGYVVLPLLPTDKTVDPLMLATGRWPFVTGRMWIDVVIQESTRKHFRLPLKSLAGRCRWPECSCRSSHATSWGHAWYLDPYSYASQFTWAKLGQPFVRILLNAS